MENQYDDEEITVQIKVGARGVWMDVPVMAQDEFAAVRFIERQLSNLKGKTVSFTNEPTNNVELVTAMMEFSKFGALAQAFIVEAITRYAKQVSNSTPEQYGENSIVAPESWIGVGKEIKTKMDAFYKRTN